MNPFYVGFYLFIYFASHLGVSGMDLSLSLCVCRSVEATLIGNAGNLRDEGEY